MGLGLATPFNFLASRLGGCSEHYMNFLSPKTIPRPIFLQVMTTRCQPSKTETKAAIV